MIRLNVEEYCHVCGKFRPDLETIAYHGGFDTIVCCEDRDKCRAIAKYLREVVKNER